MKLIKKHEGYEQFPYKDSVGKLTIGYGRNLEDKGITKKEAEFLLENDIYNAIFDLMDIFKDFYSYPDNVKLALIDMMFNLGKTRFLTFKKMIAAIKNKDWSKASYEAQSSKWCRQVGSRCKDIAKLIEREK